MNEVVDRVLELLAVRRMSKAELARRVDITPERMNHYIGPSRRSEVDLHLLCRFCDALETHPNYLLGYSSRPEPEHADQISQIRGIEKELQELRRVVAHKK